MSADFILSAMKEAKDKINAQHARIEELLQKTQQLERENAALKGALAKADVLAKYAFNEEGRELRAIECWVYPEDVIVRMDRAAFDAAREEAQS